MASLASNIAGLDLSANAKEAIDDELRPLRTRLETLLASLERAAVTDDDTAGKATDLSAMFSSLRDQVDNAHEKVKMPYLDAGRVVDGNCNALRGKIDDARTCLESMLTRYQTDKQARIDAERAAEREREAADPEPGYRPERPSSRKAATVRGDMGASAHLRDHDVVIIDNVKKVPKTILENQKVLEAIRSVVKPVLKAGQKVAGCRLEKITKSQTRKS